MFLPRRKVRIETERLTLRQPLLNDHREWATLRKESADFLIPWEPTWADDHLARKGFSNRVYWAQRSISQGTALPLFLIRRTDNVLLGAITLDNIRRGPARRAPWAIGSASPMPGRDTCVKRSSALFITPLNALI